MRELELAVFLANQSKELAGVGRLEKLLAEVSVAQQARHAREGLQMEAGGILRRDQHEKKMGRVAVERFEIDALNMAAEGPEDFGDLGQLAVRDRYAVADRRRAQALALGQHRGHLAGGDLRMLFGEA